MGLPHPLSNTCCLELCFYFFLLFLHRRAASLSLFPFVFALSKGVFGSFANLTLPCTSCRASPHPARRGEAQNAPLLPFSPFLDALLHAFLARCWAWASCLPSSRLASPVSICFYADSHRFPLHPWLSPSYNGFLFQGRPLAASSLL